MNGLPGTGLMRIMAALPAAALVAIFPARLAAQEPPAHGSEGGHAHWSYAGATGPEHWAEEDPQFAACGAGKRQSPIDIEHATTKALPAIEFDYRAVPLTVTDTGHSFQVNVPAGSGGITVGGERYELVQFHFHKPSEETFDGHHFAMVAHLVHKNAKGELAVVAVLIHQGAENAFLKPVFDDFPARGKTEATVSGASVNLADFLPKERGYYTFDGSLTTPPCTEHVRWFVLKNAVTASPGQIGQFAARYPRDARPTQPLNDREVTATSD
jgi:carbonic anhydrase